VINANGDTTGCVTHHVRDGVILGGRRCLSREEPIANASPLLMRVLILGGSRFLGRFLAQAALARGHDLVLFNRAQTNPELFPEATHVRGDRRAGGLEKLVGQEFDLAFDTSAYYPADIDGTRPLASSIAHYSLVSSISVYRDPVSAYADETAPLFTLKGPIPKEFSTPEEYGALKALCEGATSEIYGERALVVRPGLVIGPYDYTDRLTSWIRRIAGRRTVIAGEPDQPLQLIDVRDLADWMMRAAESQLAGIYNALGPEAPMTFADFVAATAAATQSTADVVWAGDEFLEEREVMLPLWVARKDRAFFQLSNTRAVADGLRFRSLQETVSDVRAWRDEQPGGIDPDSLPTVREDELLRERTELA
jgi:nucleoside-diphosphate-sugar epimerase